MDMISLERVAEYAAEDADVTLRLKQVLWPKVEELDLAGLYLEIEEPMIAVLAEIEMAGVRIDSEALAEYAVELNKTLNDLEGDIRRLADEPSLNVNSARQLGEVLFGKAPHRGEAQDDQNQAVFDRGGVLADLRPQIRDRR